jgi:hypothetical protein
MTITVTVTAEDKPDNDRECPVARALHRTCLGSEVEVDSFEIRVNPHRDDGYTLASPDSVSAFVDAFDDNCGDLEPPDPPAPFTFDLEVPEP